MEANKENAPSQRLSGVTIIESGSDSTSLQVDNHDRVLPSKAQSSLASSSFQAMGFLPQFDGAGRAQTSNVHQQHGIPSLPRAAKVNLPRASTSSDHSSTLGPGTQITPSAAVAPQSPHKSKSRFDLDVSAGEPPESGKEVFARKEKAKGKGTAPEILTKPEYIPNVP